MRQFKAFSGLLPSLFFSLVSCVQDNVTILMQEGEGEGIYLSVMADYGLGTKGEIADRVPDTFKMFGCAYTGSRPEGSNVMYNEEMIFDGEKWVSCSKILWPSDESRVYLWAAGNTEGVSYQSRETEGWPEFFYRSPVDYDGQEDLIVATKGPMDGMEQGMTMHFRHALAGVRFIFADDGTFDGTLTSLTLNNIYTEGTYSLRDGWYNVCSPSSRTLTFCRDVTSEMSGELVNGNEGVFFIIPQQCRGDAMISVSARNADSEMMKKDISLRDVTLEEGVRISFKLNLSDMEIIGN